MFPRLSSGRMNRLAEFGSRNLKRLPQSIRSANGSLAVFLLFAVVILFLLVGAVRRWHLGAGANSVAVDIIWRVVWITHVVFEVWLIIVVIVLLSRWWSQRTNG